MTEPTRPPEPWSAEAYAYANRPTFCVECQVHQATAAKPLCPVCLDEVRRMEAAS